LDLALHGSWFIAFLALVLSYYFVLEAVSGQTVGKRLLGLRVSRAGERASVGAVAGRTVLRLVDWLPFLYLVGFVTMLATGARRQRVGDLAAQTSVVRTPVRHRGLALVPVAVVLLAAVGLSVYRVNSPAPHTYRAHGISFAYPAGWSVASLDQHAGHVGDAPLWETAVSPGTKLDLITVQAYRMDVPVTAQDIDAVMPELESVTRQGFDQIDGAVQAGPEKITVAGQPAVRFRGTGTVKGSQVDSTVVFVLSGTDEYFIDCQHTAAQAAEVERACTQVVGSFQLHGATNNASTPSVAEPATSPEPPASSAAGPAGTASATPSPTTSTSPRLVSFDKLRRGDCIESFPPNAEEGLPVVPCDRLHEEEVIAARDLGPGPWPGASTTDARSNKFCTQEFASYVGIPRDQSRYDLEWWPPVKESWELGDRSMQCVVSDPSGKTVGTLRGARS
jgi:hypothetical protein